MAKRKSEASQGSNAFTGAVEKRFSSSSNKKKRVNIDIVIPPKQKLPPVPTHAHQPLKHYTSTSFGMKNDIIAQKSSGKLQGNELISKISRSGSN